MAGTLTYQGGGFDTEVEPAVQKTAIEIEGGKRRRVVLKRQYAKPAVLRKVEVDTWRLWGYEFPKGVPVEVDDEELVRKAMALKKGLFAYEGDPVLVDARSKRAREKRLARKLALRGVPIEQGEDIEAVELSRAIAAGQKAKAAKASVSPAPVEPAAEDDKPRSRSRRG